MATEYKLSYTASEINNKLGQIDNLATKSEVTTNVSSHNTNTSAHADIREQISQLSSEIVDKTRIQEMIDAKFNSIVNGNEVAY